MNAPPPSSPQLEPIVVPGARDDWRRLRAAFHAAGWRREELERRMGGPEGLRALAEGDAALASWRLRGADDFARLARFFLLGEPLPSEELTRTFAAADVLPQLGLAAPCREGVRATVGWRPTATAPAAVPLPGDDGFPRGGSALDRWMWDLAAGPPARKGWLARCGGGELPVWAFETCESAVLAERREEVARRTALSAALRGSERLSAAWSPDAAACLAGSDGPADCDLALLGPEGWDVVLAEDAPFDPAARWDAEFAWLEAALGRLAPGGRGAAALSGPAGDPGAVVARLQATLASRGCDGQLFVSSPIEPEDLAARGGRFGDRLGALREAGFVALRRFFLVLRGGRRGSKPLFSVEATPGPIRGRGYEHFQRIWKGLEFLRDQPDPASWLKQAFLPSDGVEAESRCRVVKTSWTVAESELVSTQGVPFRTPLSATLPGIVPSFDGVKTLGQLLSEAASGGEYPWESYLEDSLPIVRRLIARGQLSPARPKIFLG